MGHWSPTSPTKKFVESTKVVFDYFYSIFFQRDPKTVTYSGLCYEVWNAFARPCKSTMVFFGLVALRADVLNSG